jgi:hypothetical protein
MVGLMIRKDETMLCIYLFCEALHTNIAIHNPFQKLIGVLYLGINNLPWKQTRCASSPSISSMKIFQQPTTKVKLPFGKRTFEVNFEKLIVYVHINNIKT